MRFPAPGVTVTAAVINGRIRMWEYVNGPWNSSRAAAMYKGPLLRALKKAYLGHAKRKRPSWFVLEDNDPTGFKSSAARKAKAEVRILTEDLPRRSPDFNVLDYALWHAINLRMREQESSWLPERKETGEAFKLRLRRTALALPRALVTKCVAHMARRCQALWHRGGKLFPE